MRLIHFFPFLLFLEISSGLANAKDCPEISGRYGDNKHFRDFVCKISIDSDAIDDVSKRSVTFNDEGKIQIFSNFPGTTNSNSTGARVYFLFPKRNEKKILDSTRENLKVLGTSGVEFVFDKFGNMKSSNADLKITSAKEINSKNKSGVEIENYKRGLIFDLGYRNGNTPDLNPEAQVTVTDKNNKKCQIVNKEFMIVTKNDSELRYKSNSALHKFLASRCPSLDISDLETIDSSTPIRSNAQININDTSRFSTKPKTTSESTNPDSNTSNSTQK